MSDGQEYERLPDEMHLLGRCLSEGLAPSQQELATFRLRAISVIEALSMGKRKEAWQLIPECTMEADAVTMEMAEIAALLIRSTPRGPVRVVEELRMLTINAGA